MRWPEGDQCPLCGQVMQRVQQPFRDDAFLCRGTQCEKRPTKYPVVERETGEGLDKHPTPVRYAEHREAVAPRKPRGPRPVSGTRRKRYPAEVTSVEKDVLATANAQRTMRCVIGRHKVDYWLDLWFVIDGKPICLDHVLAIVEAFDAHRGAPAISEHQFVKAAAARDKRLREKQTIEAMQRKAGAQPGFVYYIRIADHIKIGYAADVAARMKAYPPSAVLLAAHPGTRDLETQMHHDFRSYLDMGREWFTPGPQLMAHIDRVRDRFGDPAVLAHRYKTAKRAS